VAVLETVDKLPDQTNQAKSSGAQDSSANVSTFRVFENENSTATGAHNISSLSRLIAQLELDNKQGGSTIFPYTR